MNNFNDLLKDSNSIAEKAINKFRWSIGYDEAKSEALIGLWGAYKKNNTSPASLYKRMTWRMLNFYRKQKITRDRDSIIFAHMVNKVKNRVDISDDKDYIRIMLERIPEEWRLIITEHYFENRSLSQISQRHNITKTTVVTRLNKGIERLKVLLERGKCYE